MSMQCRKLHCMPMAPTHDISIQSKFVLIFSLNKKKSYKIMAFLEILTLLLLEEDENEQ